MSDFHSDLHLTSDTKLLCHRRFWKAVSLYECVCVCWEGGVSTDSTDAIQSVRRCLWGYRHFLIALPDAYQCSPPHRKDECTLLPVSFLVPFALIIVPLSQFVVIDVFSWHPLAVH